MATLKNSEVLDALIATNSLMQEKLPFSTALKLKKLHRALKQDWDDVEEIRKTLIDTYGEKDAEGKQVFEEGSNHQRVKLVEDKKEEFEVAFKELMAAEVTIDITLTEADFGGKEVTAATLNGLGNLIEG